MNRLHIVGRKHHGKTTLVADLVSHFTKLGHSVATIKHTHHAHELDTPGKDSFRHRQAGASVVGIVAKNLCAAFWPTPAGGDPANDTYARFEELLEECDVVLVEGDLQATAPKIEVWRAAIGPAPLAAENDSILAVVSDDPVPVRCATYPRSDLSSLVQRIWTLWPNVGR